MQVKYIDQQLLVCNSRLIADWSLENMNPDPIQYRMSLDVSALPKNKNLILIRYCPNNLQDLVNWTLYCLSFDLRILIIPLVSYKIILRAVSELNVWECRTAVQLNLYTLCGSCTI